MNKLDKMFNVVRMCRQDLVDNGMEEKDALDLSDEQMQTIANNVSEGLGGDNFRDCLSYVVDSFNRDKEKTINQ